MPFALDTKERIAAEDAVFWCHDETHQIMIQPHSWGSSRIYPEAWMGRPR
jgi:hypothetical protein